jgi:hypothetical protein
MYRHSWGLSRADEKRGFQDFVDFVMARWAEFPDMHIYHYAPYEPAALKRLMGRYATREEELDRMLRAKLFVDLYQVVRHGIRVGVESYSIKRLEPLYAFDRDAALPDVNAALALLQANIELDDISSISEETKATVLITIKTIAARLLPFAIGSKACVRKSSSAARRYRGQNRVTALPTKMSLPGSTRSIPSLQS